MNEYKKDIVVNRELAQATNDAMQSVLGEVENKESVFIWSRGPVQNTRGASLTFAGMHEPL